LSSVSVADLQVNVSTSTLVARPKLIEVKPIVTYPIEYTLEEFKKQKQGFYIVFSKTENITEHPFFLCDVQTVVEHLDEDVNFLTYVNIESDVSQLNIKEYRSNTYSIITQVDFPDEFFRKIAPLEKKTIYEYMINTKNRHLNFLYFTVCDKNRDTNDHVCIGVNGSKMTVADDKANNIDIYYDKDPLVLIYTKFDTLVNDNKSIYFDNLINGHSNKVCKIHTKSTRKYAYVKNVPYSHMIVGDDGYIKLNMTCRPPFTIYTNAEFSKFIKTRLNPFYYGSLLWYKPDKTLELCLRVVKSFGRYGCITDTFKNEETTKAYIKYTVATAYVTVDYEIAIRKKQPIYSDQLCIEDIPNNILSLPSIYGLINDKIQTSDYWKIYLHEKFKKEWKTPENIAFVFEKIFTEYIPTLQPSFVCCSADIQVQLENILPFGTDMHHSYRNKITEYLLKNNVRPIPSGRRYRQTALDAIKDIYVKYNKMNDWYLYILQSVNNDTADYDEENIKLALDVHPSYFTNIPFYKNIFTIDLFEYYCKHCDPHHMMQKIINIVPEIYETFGDENMKKIIDRFDELSIKLYRNNQCDYDNLCEKCPHMIKFIRPLYRTPKINRKACRTDPQLMQYVVVDDENFYITELNYNHAVFPYIKRKSERVILHALVLNSEYIKYVYEPTTDMLRIVKSNI